MIYIIAITMSYLVGHNYLIQLKSKLAGTYSNPTLNLLSGLGGIGGWFCIIPAAIIITTAYDYEILDGFLFLGAAYLGSLVAGLVTIESMLGRANGFVVGYFLSALTLPINIGQVIYLYIQLH